MTNNEPNSTLYIFTPANNAKTSPQPQMRRNGDNSNSQVYLSKPQAQPPPQSKAISKSTAVTAVKPAQNPKVPGNKLNNNKNQNNANANTQPPVKRLADKFKKSGLGIIDSYFNAYYFYYNWKSEKNGRKPKACLATIAQHPRGWGRNRGNSEIYENNTYDKYMAFLTFIAKLWGFVCVLLKPVSNFLKSVRDFFAIFSNASKASKNIGYIAQKSFAFMLPVASVVFTVMMILNINSFKPEFELSFNGENIGFVDSKETVGTVVSLLENNVSSVLGEQYEFTGDLSYKIVLTNNKAYVSESELYNLMYSSCQVQNAITTAYGLYIDGELIGAAENASDINKVLNEILEENSGDIGDDGTIGFANEIEIIENKYAKRDVVTQDELKDIITYTPENPVVAGVIYNSAESKNAEAEIDSDSGGGSVGSEYIIEDSEVPLAGINANSLMSGEYPEDMSIGSEDIASIAAGSSIDLTPEAINTIPRGFLSSDENNNMQDAVLSRLSKTSGSTTAGSILFKKVKTEIYTEDMPFEVKYVESSQYYTGTQTVQTNGAYGEKMITADVTYINDNEVSREIKEVETIKEPVDKVVLVGTKVKPLPGPTGGFIRPVKGGYISCYFSGGHRAIDIPLPYGSKVSAADGGTVIHAGFGGSYGNYVKIRHSDGYVTLYAHLSSISVSYGDKVFQGQEIGKVGSTGYSTGNHLHFEIIKNGVQVNPLSYLN